MAPSLFIEHATSAFNTLERRLDPSFYVAIPLGGRIGYVFGSMLTTSVTTALLGMLRASVKIPLGGEEEDDERNCFLLCFVSQALIRAKPIGYGRSLTRLG